MDIVRLKSVFSRFYSIWNTRSTKEKFLYIFFTIILIWALFQQFACAPPRAFPLQTTIEIPKGTTLYKSAETLEQKAIVKSSFWFKFFVRMFGGSGNVIAGDYFFDRPQDVIDIAWRITHGDYHLVQLRTTIPEGSTNFQIAEILKSQYSFFDSKHFLQNAEQGKMFPDTYFFLPNSTSSEIIERIKQNFDAKIKTIESDIASSTHSFDDILIMASLLEEEAKTGEDRKIVAGILWKRLKIGMPLQVDVAMETYDRKGLPLTPITNPGLEAIKDALYPTETKYLYYLSDKSGKIYYAEDFEGHQRNRALYLGR